VRKIPTWQTTRRALTLTAIAAFVTGGALLTAGTASAATTLAGSCNGSVTGNMGDTVAVAGTSVKELVRQGAQNYVNSHWYTVATVWPNSLADTIAGKGALTVGSVPQSAGGSIAGDAIGTVVANALKGANGLGLLDSTKNEVLAAVRSTVAQNCGLTTLAGNYVAPSTPGPNAGNGGQAGTADSGAGSLGNLNPGDGSGTAPRRDYSDIPTAVPGVATAPGIRYPQNGTLPGDAAVPQAGDQSGQSGQGPDIRAAGNAESLASPGSSRDVQLPMLLAVIVLAGVTAGLVRTWALRRAG